MNLKKQILSLYTHTFFASLRLTDAVWVALLAARGFSLWEIGLAESIYHIVSLTCEVPSGMLADLLGRRRTLLCGEIIAILSNLPMLFSLNLFLVCLGMGASALSATMLSGTEEALVYDSLKMLGREDEYLKINANMSQIGQLSGGVGSLSSLLDSVWGFAGYYWACIGAHFAAALAAFGLREPIVTEAQAARKTQSLAALPGRFREQLRTSIACLRRNPLAVRLIAASAAICLPVYLGVMFAQERLVSLGWPTAWLCVPALTKGAASMLGLALGGRLHPRSRRSFYAACALMCGAGTLLVGTSPSAVGVLAGEAMVECLVDIWLLHEQRWLNDTIPSDQRATIISIDTAVYSLLMIPISPLVGWIGDMTAQPGAGLCALGVLVAGSVVWAVKK